MNPSSSSSSSSSVKKSRSELPEELILAEIVSRLPIENILDCKLVCKGWLHMIRKRFFIDKHLQYQLLRFHHFHDHKYYPTSTCTDDDNSKIGFVVGIQETPEDEEYFMYYKEYNDGVITTKKFNHCLLAMHPGDMFIDSCNGLICLARYICNNPVIYICNPVTREGVELPEFSTPNDNQVFGFGYDATSKDYKAVRIVHPKTENSYEYFGSVQVYTLGSGSGWRDKERIEHWLIGLRPGAFVDGALHWLDVEGRVWAFHLGDEKFRMLTTLPFSCHVDNEDRDQRLVVIGGWLSVLEYFRLNYVHVHIWLFKKIEEKEELMSWSQEYCIEYFSPMLGLTKMGQLLCMWNRELICLCEKDAEKIYDIEVVPPIHFGMLHVNSFISLKEMGEKDVQAIESAE